MRHFWHQLILFTLISSLASAQWESDRFLFEEPSSVARPKANREPSREKTKEPTFNKIKSEEPKKIIEKNNPDVKPPIDISREGEIAERSVVIDVFLGQCDLNSDGLDLGGPTPRRSFGLGVKLLVPIEDKISLQTHFWSAPNLGRDKSTIKNEQLRLDQFGVDLLFSSDQVTREKFGWGAYVEQFSLWGSSYLEQLDAVQTNLLGLKGLYTPPPQGRWNSNIEMKVAPILFSNQKNLRGNSVSLNWSSGLALEGGRAFLLSLGMETTRYSSLDVNQKSISINQLQILIGYRISTSRQK